MIIGIGGQIGNGKDTVAKMIQFYFGQKNSPEYFNSLGVEKFIKYYETSGFNSVCSSCENYWEIKKFAFKLKKLICKFTGCTMENLEDSNFKENVFYNITTGDIAHSGELKVIEFWNKKLMIDKVMLEYPENSYVLFRVLLQDIGMKLRSSIPLFHINGLFSEYKPSIEPEYEDAKTSIEFYPNWIISDVRLLNEARSIKNLGGILLRVIKNSEKENGHISETQLTLIKYDYTIYNNGTIKELYNKVVYFLENTPIKSFNI